MDCRENQEKHKLKVAILLTTNWSKNKDHEQHLCPQLALNELKKTQEKKKKGKKKTDRETQKAFRTGKKAENHRRQP